MLQGLHRNRKTLKGHEGITFKETEEESSIIEAESLLIAQTFGQQAAKSNDVDFGGGKFGGGGAGGDF